MNARAAKPASSKGNKDPSTHQGYAPHGKGRTVSEPERSLPIIDTVDVLVVGAGPAGVVAAIAAAREGASTLLVESSGCLGGVWTVSGQMHAACFHDGKKVVVKGIISEIFDRLHALGAGESPQLTFSSGKLRQKRGQYAVAFEPEIMKRLLDEMAEEAGVHVLFHTMCVAVVMRRNQIKGIIVENKSGRQAILSKVTLDCSGDADVAFFAGVPTLKGRGADGKCQPPSTIILMAGVDYPRAREWLRNDPSQLARLEKTPAHEVN